ncbi:hypothetical protein C8J56DRAFT_1056228 [Mycena floridula]|nr:hypothetical protein C8J56DRAFT_1056228 [Mycena floridula]
MSLAISSSSCASGLVLTTHASVITGAIMMILSVRSRHLKAIQIEEEAACQAALKEEAERQTALEEEEKERQRLESIVSDESVTSNHNSSEEESTSTECTCDEEYEPSKKSPIQKLARRMSFIKDTITERPPLRRRSTGSFLPDSPNSTDSSCPSSKPSSSRRPSLLRKISSQILPPSRDPTTFVMGEVTTSFENPFARRKSPVYPEDSPLHPNNCEQVRAKVAQKYANLLGGRPAHPRRITLANIRGMKNVAAPEEPRRHSVATTERM